MALVSVGAVGAAAPTDFEESWFLTLSFCKKMPFIFVFLRKYKNLQPQSWNPNDDPVIQGPIKIEIFYLKIFQKIFISK